MKTDELIDMLGTNLEPVKSGRFRDPLFIALAVAVGTAAALCLVWAALGVRTQAPGAELFGFTAIALALTLGLAAAGVHMLFALARPGVSGRRPLVLIGLLFLAVVSAAGIALSVLDSATWNTMLLGGPWGSCLVCIPIFAVIPFVAFIWALRRGAPTQLTLSGAIAGLVAGALAAAAVVVHQAGDSLAFIALWYGGPIALCALVGGILGPQLLRW